MAEFKGTNKTLIDSVPPVKVPKGEAYGIKRVIYDEFVVTEDMSGDTVLMGAMIPAGARIHQVTLYSPDMGTVTADVGWNASADGAEVADPDGFFDGVDIGAAADAFLMTEVLGTVNGIFKQFASAVQTVILFNTTTGTSGTIKLAIEFVVD
jgi:hypothetical protein